MAPKSFKRSTTTQLPDEKTDHFKDARASLGEMPKASPSKTPKALKRSATSIAPKSPQTPKTPKTPQAPKAPVREAKPSSKVKEEEAATKLQAAYRGAEVRKKQDAQSARNVAMFRAVYSSSRSKFVEEKKNMLKVSLKSTAKIIQKEVGTWTRKWNIMGMIVQGSEQTKLQKKGRDLVLKSLGADDLDVLEEYINSLLQEIESTIAQFEADEMDATELIKLKENLLATSKDLSTANEARKASIKLLEKLEDPMLGVQERAALHRKVEHAVWQSQQYGASVADKLVELGFLDLDETTLKDKYQRENLQMEADQRREAKEQRRASKLRKRRKKSKQSASKSFGDAHADANAEAEDEEEAEVGSEEGDALEGDTSEEEPEDGVFRSPNSAHQSSHLSSATNGKWVPSWETSSSKLTSSEFQALDMLRTWEPEGYQQMMEESARYGEDIERCAASIQNSFRALQKLKKRRQEQADRQEKAAVAIQARGRGMLVRTTRRKQEKAAVAIQARGRGMLARTRQRDICFPGTHDKTGNAQVVLVARSSTVSVLIHESDEEEIKQDVLIGFEEEAAVAIQARCRGMLVRRDLAKDGHVFQATAKSGKGKRKRKRKKHKYIQSKTVPMVEMSEEYQAECFKNVVDDDLKVPRPPKDLEYLAEDGRTVAGIGDVPIQLEELSRKTPTNKIKSTLASRRAASVLASMHRGETAEGERRSTVGVFDFLGGNSSEEPSRSHSVSAVSPRGSISSMRQNNDSGLDSAIGIRAGSVVSGESSTRPSTRAASAMTGVTTWPSTGPGVAEFEGSLSKSLPGKGSTRQTGSISPNPTPIEEVAGQGVTPPSSTSSCSSEPSSVSTPKSFVTETESSDSSDNEAREDQGKRKGDTMAKAVTVEVDPWCGFCTRRTCRGCLDLYPQEVTAKRGKLEVMPWKTRLEQICGPENFVSKFSEAPHSSFKSLSNRAFSVIEKWGIQQAKNKYLKAGSENATSHEARAVRDDCEIASLRGIGRKAPAKRTPAEVDFLVQHLRSKCNNFFSAVPDRMIAHTARHLQSRRFVAGEVLWGEGDPATWACVILIGEICMESSSSAETRSITANQMVGAADIVSSKPPDFNVHPESERIRKSHATATKRTDALVLNTVLLTEITEFKQVDSREKKSEVLRKVFHLTMKAPRLIPKIVDFWRLELFPKNHVICVEGKFGTENSKELGGLQEGIGGRLVIIEHGEVVLKSKGKNVATRGRGAVLGEESLTGKPYMYTITCESMEVAAMSISVEDYVHHVAKPKHNHHEETTAQQEEERKSKAPKAEFMKKIIWSEKTKSDAKAIEEKEWKSQRGRHKLPSRTNPPESCAVDRFAPESFTGVVSQVEVGMPTKCDLSPHAHREWIATKGLRSTMNSSRFTHGSDQSTMNASACDPFQSTASWMNSSLMSDTSTLISERSLSRRINKSMKSYSSTKAQHHSQKEENQHFQDADGFSLGVIPPVTPPRHAPQGRTVLTAYGKKRARESYKLQSKYYSSDPIPWDTK